jgi:RNA polymerase sigma factor (sigma-70 family)
MSTTDRPVGMFTSAEGFADVLRPHLETVAHVARRFAPAAEAEDVAQEALLAAWRYRQGFDPRRGTFRAWLLAIVLKESRKAGGRRRRRESVVEELVTYARGGQAPAHHGPEGDPSLAALERAMAALSRRQREIVDLYYFVDLPVDEVAAVLGLSSGTVKSTLAASRERIRQLLGSGE